MLTLDRLPLLINKPHLLEATGFEKQDSHFSLPSPVSKDIMPGEVLELELVVRSCIDNLIIIIILFIFALSWECTYIFSGK